MKLLIVGGSLFLNVPNLEKSRKSAGSVFWHQGLLEWIEGACAERDKDKEPVCGLFIFFYVFLPDDCCSGKLLFNVQNCMFRKHHLHT